MIDEHLAEQAALYASGVLTKEERDLFELLLEFHRELAAHSTGLLEITAAATLATQPASAPCPQVKARVLAALDHRPQTRASGVVVAGPDQRVLWVNAAFSEMCGFSLQELEGKSLGPMLQGEKTDRATAERMRRAVADRVSCHEKILNYHKDGSTYWVEIEINPFFDDRQELRWMIAREREIQDQSIAA